MSPIFFIVWDLGANRDLSAVLLIHTTLFYPQKHSGSRYIHRQSHSRAIDGLHGVGPLASPRSPWFIPPPHSLDRTNMPI